MPVSASNAVTRALVMNILPRIESDWPLMPRAAIFSRAPGAAVADPFGSSNMPGLRPSRKVSTSDVFTTSAYFAFMSQRLIAWLACERSKQPSSAIATR